MLPILVLWILTCCQVPWWNHRCDKNYALWKSYALAERSLHQGSHGEYGTISKLLKSWKTNSTGIHWVGKSHIQARDNGYKDGHSNKEVVLRGLICGTKFSGVHSMRQVSTIGMAQGMASVLMVLFMNHQHRSSNYFILLNVDRSWRCKN